MPGSAQHAAARTAGVLRGLPDSGLIVRLTRGRGWIALLSVLLTGIVALNVVSLSLNASQGKIAQQSLILEQENSALRARLAQRLANDRVRNAAASLGMTSPGPQDISYVDSTGKSIRITAQRLAAGFGYGSSLASVPTTTSTAPTTTVSAPTTTATTTTSPTTTSTTTTAPATTSTPVSAPTAPTTSTGTPGGGVSPG
jgi:hypothetical protein